MTAGASRRAVRVEALCSVGCPNGGTTAADVAALRAPRRCGGRWVSHLAIAAVLCDEPRGGSLLGEMTPVPTLHLVLIFVGLAVLARGVGWLVSGASPRVTRPVT